MIKKIILIVVAVGVLALLSFRIVEALKTKEQASAPRPGGSGPAVVVETAIADISSFQEAIELTGELRALAQVAVAPRVSGRLSQVLVDNGDFVRKGQLLATIDDLELQQQARTAAASIQVAEAGLKQDIANLENLRSQLRRHERLYESKLVSLQALEDLRSRAKAAEAQQELAEAQINQARASLKELEIQIEQTRLYAPMAGYIGERMLHPGAQVSASSSIFSLLDLSRLKTIVAASEQHLRNLRVGLPTRITVDAYPNETFTGTISRMSPFLDPSTRAAEVEIIIPNREALLKAGMFVRAAIIIRDIESLAVPRESVVTRESRNAVFLIEDDKAHLVEVKIGVSQKGKVQILEGLLPGQEVVAAGAQFLNEGDAVRRPGQQPGRPGQRQGGGRRNPS